MKMTEDAKRLVEIYKKLESDKCKADLVFQAETMARAQEALKADYGLVGRDAPLFNGAGALPMAQGTV